MIFQGFIDYFINLFTPYVESLNTTVEIPSSIFTVMSDLFGSLGYFFPVVQLMPILVLSIAFAVFRIFVSFVCRVKSFIPTMGS